MFSKNVGSAWYLVESLMCSFSWLAGSVKSQQGVSEIACQTPRGSEDRRWRITQNILDFPKCVPNVHASTYIKDSKSSHYSSSYASPSSGLMTCFLLSDSDTGKWFYLPVQTLANSSFLCESISDWHFCLEVVYFDCLLLEVHRLFATPPSAIMLAKQFCSYLLIKS